MDIKPLITLLAIVNPFAIVPFFIHYTQGYTHAQRMRTAKVSAISAFFVISISALIGQQLLGFFGISIASFQVGGGLLLLISSLSMLNAQPAEAKASAQRIAEGAPLVARWHKKFARRLMDPRPITAAEYDECFDCFDTEDFRIGYAAFLAKQKPEFVGK